MKHFLRFLLLFGLLVTLAAWAVDYSAPTPGPSKNLRAWSLLSPSDRPAFSDMVWTNNGTVVPISPSTPVEVYGGFYALTQTTNTDGLAVYESGGGVIGVKGQSSARGGSLQGIGVFGMADYVASTNYGLAGLAANEKDNSAAVGVFSTSFNDGVYTNAVQVGALFELGASYSGPEPTLNESAVVIADARGTDKPLFLGRTNNGTTVFKVGADGTISLSGETNRLGDNGAAITFNGAVIGEQVWTNDSGVVHPSTATQFRVDLSTTNFPIATLSDNASGYATNAVKIAAQSANAYLNINSELPDSSEGTFINLNATPTAAFLSLSDENVNWVSLQPWATDATNAIAYQFSSAAPLTNSGALLMAVQNHGTNKFTVSPSGLASAAAGFASTDTTAAVNIAATGWTNTFGKNAVVYFDGVGVTATVYNNAGTAIYTNATSLGGGSILLQPSGKVILSGTSVVGRAAPF